VREREDANRTREAGHLDEIQGVVANTLKLHRNGALGFIDWLGRRGNVFAEKNLSRKNDRERRNNHHSKRERDQPHAAAPPKKGTAAVHAARSEKPATQNDENEQQQHACTILIATGWSNAST
jgi:hypothetical protein